MSNRHHQSRPGASHKAVPPREDRIFANRQARHSASAELREVRKGADPEDLAETLPAHISGRYVPDDDTPTVKSRRVRHWKQPFWKRRSAQRRRRVEAELAVVAGD